MIRHMESLREEYAMLMRSSQNVSNDVIIVRLKALSFDLSQTKQVCSTLTTRERAECAAMEEAVDKRIFWMEGTSDDKPQWTRVEWQDRQSMVGGEVDPITGLPWGAYPGS